MEEAMIKVGRQYLCQAIGLKKLVTGEVIGKFERCGILYVKDYSSCDKHNVIDKASKVVVRYSDFIEEI